MRCRSAIALALVLCFWPLPALGGVEQQVLGTLSLDSAPLDVALAPDGERVFVLLEGGLVEIYSNRGDLLERVTVEGKPDRIDLSQGGDVLVLGSSSSREVRLVRLDYLQEFATQGSPAKGPADAAAEIVVFNDFQ